VQLPVEEVRACASWHRCPAYGGQRNLRLGAAAAGGAEVRITSVFLADSLRTESDFVGTPESRRAVDLIEERLDRKEPVPDVDRPIGDADGGSGRVPTAGGGDPLAIACSPPGFSWRHDRPAHT
jgi:hypothetical protein